MKKLLTASFLTLGIILISGCSFTEQKPVDNSAMTEQITALQQQMSGFASQMETLKSENEQLKIENQNLKTNLQQESDKTEVVEKSNLSENKKFNSSDIESIRNKIEADGSIRYEGYDRYKLQDYKGGKVFAVYGGNDGWTLDLIFEKNGKGIKEDKGVFWYGGSNKLYVYCLEQCNETGCKKTKRTDDNAVGLDHCIVETSFNCKEGDLCSKSVFEYVHDIVNGNKKSKYFSERYNIFIGGL